MTDVVVCGGGVIGMAAAMMLARDGHEVTVLERDAASVPASATEAWERWDRVGVPRSGSHTTAKRYGALQPFWFPKPITRQAGGMSTPRIDPLTPPYEPAVAAQLESMMPPGVPPIGLFRTFVLNLPMAEAMGGWGGYELSKRLSLSMRQRELVIDRVTARCRCEYEWGVHLAFFGDRVGLTADQKRSITHGTAHDPCWSSEEAALIRAVDELHDHADISDTTWSELASTLTAKQSLDLFMLAGWYHAISYAANAARIPLEDGVPRFAEFK